MMLRIRLCFGPQKLRISKIAQRVWYFGTTGFILKTSGPPQVLLGYRLALKGPSAMHVREDIQRQNIVCDTEAGLSGWKCKFCISTLLSRGRRFYRMLCLKSVYNLFIIKVTV